MQPRNSNMLLTSSNLFDPYHYEGEYHKIPDAHVQMYGQSSKNPYKYGDYHDRHSQHDNSHYKKRQQVCNPMNHSNFTETVWNEDRFNDGRYLNPYNYAGPNEGRLSRYDYRDRPKSNERYRNSSRSRDRHSSDYKDNYNYRPNERFDNRSNQTSNNSANRPRPQEHVNANNEINKTESPDKRLRSHTHEKSNVSYDRRDRSNSRNRHRDHVRFNYNNPTENRYNVDPTKNIDKQTVNDKNTNQDSENNRSPNNRNRSPSPWPRSSRSASNNSENYQRTSQ